MHRHPFIINIGLINIHTVHKYIKKNRFSGSVQVFWRLKSVTKLKRKCLVLQYVKIGFLCLYVKGIKKVDLNNTIFELMKFDHKLQSNNFKTVLQDQRKISNLTIT